MDKVKNNIAIVVTDNYELKQYVRFFRDELTRHNNLITFFMPGSRTSSKVRFQFKLLPNEKIQFIEDCWPGATRDHLLRLYYFRERANYWWRLRYYFPLTIKSRRRWIWLKFLIMGILYFMPKWFLNVRIKKTELLFQRFDMVLFCRPDSLLSFTAGSSAVLNQKNHVLIRNVDSLSIKGVPGKYDTVYYKDAFSELMWKLFNSNLSSRQVSFVKHEIPALKNIIVALGDSSDYEETINLVIDAISSCELYDMNLTVLVHPNDVVRGYSDRLVGRLIGKTGVKIDHTLRKSSDEWSEIISLKACQSQLDLYRSADALIEVGTTISNEGDFNFVAAIVPVAEILDKVKRGVVWREHIIYQMLMADIRLFDAHEIKSFLTARMV